MKLEIKFRAWDKTNNRIEKSFEITSQGIVVSNFGQRRYHPDYELMQYTGIVDKNSNEIYEGDIVEYFVRRKRKIGLISWGIVGFWIAGELNKLMWVNHWKIAVIGNRYENPELLKGGK